MTSLQLGNSWLSTLLRICFQLPCPANLIMGNDQFAKEGKGRFFAETCRNHVANFWVTTLAASQIFPQLVNRFGVMAITGRSAMAMRRYWEYFLRRSFTACLCRSPRRRIVALPLTKT